MKRLITCLLTLAVVFSVAAGMAVGVQAQESGSESTLIDLKDLLWEVPEGASPDEMVTWVSRNNAIIEDLETYFTEESFAEYQKAFAKFKQSRNDATAADANQVAEVLVQTKPTSGNVVMIWDGQEMPVGNPEDITEEGLDKGGRLYSYGYMPRIIKMLADDPASAKGNIIILCRNHSGDRIEGHPAAIAYQAMGYNVFMLAMRSKPYSTLDMTLDLQRAIRLVKKEAADNNYGGQDMIAVASWGGAGSPAQNLVYNMYGYSNASDYIEGYVPDEIDAISCDFDVDIVIYSAFASVEHTNPVENPNLPAIYIAVGDGDEGRYPDCLAFYEEMKDKTDCQLHVMYGAGHGFGIGQDEAVNITEECKEQLPESDAFMQAHLGYSQKNSGSAPETASNSIDVRLEKGSVTVEYYDGTEILQSEADGNTLIQVPEGTMLDHMNIYNSGGAINVMGVLAKDYMLESPRADINVYLTEDTAFRAHLTTIMDLFESDFLYDVTMMRHEYIYGENGVNIEMETISGTARVMKLQ